MQVEVQIPTIYDGLYDEAEIQAHIQAEINFFLLEKFGKILKENIDDQTLQSIGQDAKKKAWEQYKDQFLKGLNLTE